MSCFSSNLRGSTPYAARAFTLIELLVAGGIVGLLLAVGVPTFRAITVSTSVQAGGNVLAARIGEARATALRTGGYAALLIYRDPITRRTSTAILTSGEQDRTNSVLDRYRSYDESGKYFSAIDGDPNRADRARHVFVEAGKRPVVVHSRCIQDADEPGERPPLENARENSHWGQPTAKLDFRIQSSEPLPRGMAAQVVTGQGSSVGGFYVGRYEGVGMILFDSTGRMAFRDADVSANTADVLGKLLTFEKSDGLASATIKCGVGVIVFDGARFTEMGFTLCDDGASAGAAFRPADEYYSHMAEAREEDWLTENGSRVLISRYSGMVSE